MKLFKIYRKNSTRSPSEGCEFTGGGVVVSWQDGNVIAYSNLKALKKCFPRHHFEPVMLPPQNISSSEFRCGFIRSPEEVTKNSAEFVQFSSGHTAITFIGGNVFWFQVGDRHPKCDPIGSGSLPHDRGEGHYLDRFFDQFKWYRYLTQRSWFLILPKGIHKPFWVDMEHIAFHPILEIECR